MKAIFLDIDGVLQPYGNQNRFEHISEVSALAKELNSRLHNDFDYYEFAGGDAEVDNKDYPNKYDIGAVYWDWDEDSVERLHKILDTTGAKIVLDTDWRGRGNEVMEALLDIHGFGKYMYGATFYSSRYGYTTKFYTEEQRYQMDNEWRRMMDKLQNALCSIGFHHKGGTAAKYMNYRSVEILEYLDRHPEITSYVAIDDMNLRRELGDHYVFTPGRITPDAGEAVLSALAEEDGPYSLPQNDVSDTLRQWREKWVVNSPHYY